MSLADELLADLEEGAGEEDEELEAAATQRGAPGGAEGQVEDVSMEISADTNPWAASTVDGIADKRSIASVAKLCNSEQLVNLMRDIDSYMSQQELQEASNKRELSAGPVESDPEYQVIVEANNLTVEIDNEISIIHKFVRDAYSKRFPELESLITVPLEYMMTVKELGNSLHQAKSNETLPEFLTNATIMIVSVTASTTQGSKLTEEEMNYITEACNMAVELNTAKAKIISYVESRMSLIAPNLSVLVGAATAAKLMGIAGGLSNLSKMPACNLQVLGSQKRTLSGFSTTAILPHTGLVYYSPIAQSTPPDLRRKAARLIAAKCALASRIDAFHESSSGTAGMNLREEIEKKLDKLMEPPPVKQVKALPKPIEVTGKKRGGRRVRKMKERLGLTQMRKNANRMQFAEIEEDAYQEDLGISLGTLGKSTGGRIRGPSTNKSSAARMSKAMQKRLHTANQFGTRTVFGGKSTVRGQASGTASSVAFTPLQGLEIVNPNAAEKSGGESTAGYFSTTSGFASAIKKTT